MRVLRDFCLAKVEKKYQDEVKTKSGVKLYVDTRFRPEWHVTIEGDVVETPERLSDQYFETRGIDLVVQKGDKIYFNYLVVDPSNEVKVGDETYYKVDYPAIFAYKRDGIMTMVGAWTFVEPYVEKKEKVGSIFLPEMSKTETHTDMGRIFRIGKPLRHEPDLGLTDGDVVLFIKSAAFTNQIDGREVYVMKQDCIRAKVSV